MRWPADPPHRGAGAACRPTLEATTPRTWSAGAASARMPAGGPSAPRAKRASQRPCRGAPQQAGPVWLVGSVSAQPRWRRGDQRPAEGARAAAVAAREGIRRRMIPRRQYAGKPIEPAQANRAGRFRRGHTARRLRANRVPGPSRHTRSLVIKPSGVWEIFARASVGVARPAWEKGPAPPQVAREVISPRVCHGVRARRRRLEGGGRYRYAVVLASPRPESPASAVRRVEAVKGTRAARG